MKTKAYFRRIFLCFFRGFLNRLLLKVITGSLVGDKRDFEFDTLISLNEFEASKLRITATIDLGDFDRFLSIVICEVVFDGVDDLVEFCIRQQFNLLAILTIGLLLENLNLVGFILFWR